MPIEQAVIEQACSFGADCMLTGVYTPAANNEKHRPCAVYVTAGLLHHIGPTGLHVDLARALAPQNIAGFRFDLSGAGDSETSTLGGYFLERSIREIQQAMDYLQQQYGHTSFVIVGLCSGADDALATAGVDNRVAGIVLLNGYAWPAGHFKLFRLLKFYLPRMLMPSKLLNRARMIMNRRGGDKSTESAHDQNALQELDDNYRYIPPIEETRVLLEQLLSERTRILFVYTGSEHEIYSYKGQLFAMFPGLAGSDCVREYYAQAADHTFVLESDRLALTQQVQQWFADNHFERVAANTVTGSLSPESESEADVHR